MALYATSNSPVRTLADLKGQRVAVSSPGSLTYWLVRRLADAQGWKLTDITPVSLGNTGGMLAAAHAGSVAAVMGGLETALALSNDASGRTLATMDTMVPHFLAHVMFATDAVIAAHPDALRAFTAGWFEAVAYIDTHADQTASAVQAAWKWHDGVSQQSQKIVMPAMSRDGRFDPEALAVVEQSLMDLGILPTRPDLTSAIDTRFLP
jgi:NitT/TauT family transport system substrate-binding protein